MIIKYNKIVSGSKRLLQNRFKTSQIIFYRRESERHLVLTLCLSPSLDCPFPPPLITPLSPLVCAPASQPSSPPSFMLHVFLLPSFISLFLFRKPIYPLIIWVLFISFCIFFVLPPHFFVLTFLSSSPWCQRVPQFEFSHCLFKIAFSFEIN